MRPFDRRILSHEHRGPYGREQSNQFARECQTGGVRLLPARTFALVNSPNTQVITARHVRVHAGSHALPVIGVGSHAVGDLHQSIVTARTEIGDR